MSHLVSSTASRPLDNFGAGVPKRLRIDHATLAAVNPRIITCSVTGFGETGPDTQRPAFDQVVQGMGGGMSITGSPDQPPMRAGIPMGDLGGGIFGAMGVLAALQARERTGRGQHVDVSMLYAQISLLTYMATMHLMSGHVPGRIGNSHFVHVPYNVFTTQDSHNLKQPARYADRPAARGTGDPVTPAPGTCGRHQRLWYDLASSYTGVGTPSMRAFNCSDRNCE